MGAILGFAFLVFWLTPMFVSMGYDRDHISTISATIFSNLISFGLLMLGSWLHGLGSVWAFWLSIILIPFTYYGIWIVSSETFGGYLLHLLRFGPARKPKKSKK